MDKHASSVDYTSLKRLNQLINEIKDIEIRNRIKQTIYSNAVKKN